MKLSSSTGDFSRYFSSTADKVRAFRETKFRYLNTELTGDAILGEMASLDILAHELSEAAKYANVSLITAHAPCLNCFDTVKGHGYKQTAEIMKRAITLCGMLKIPSIVIHASRIIGASDDEFYEKNRDFYRLLLPTAEKYGIEILTENMQYYDGHPLSTGKELRRFVDYVDHPLFGVCWDTAHGNLNPFAKEEGQYKCITDIGDKLRSMHVSDNFGDGAHHHTWPFAGIINFDEVVQGLIDVGYKGFFNFEASYSLIHHLNLPYHRKPWEREGEVVTKLLDPSVALKQKATDLLYECGKYILETYDIFEE